MPGDQPKLCPKHPDRFLSRKHAMQCLDMHQSLQMSTAIGDPLSFLLSHYPLANHAPVNLFPLGFSSDPPYV
jgi:hypothetical protein